MASRGSLILLPVVMAGLLLSSLAYDFYVGGKDGWVLKPSESYDHWSQKSRFQISDLLVFKYNKASDSVLVVNKQDFDTCSTSNPITKLDGGDSSFKLDRSGKFYFITGNQSNCQNGQKLAITVISPRSTPPRPSSPLPPSPGSSPGRTSPPSPPSTVPSSSPGITPPVAQSPAPLSPPGKTTPSFPPSTVPSSGPSTNSPGAKTPAPMSSPPSPSRSHGMTPPSSPSTAPSNSPGSTSPLPPRAAPLSPTITPSASSPYATPPSPFSISPSVSPATAPSTSPTTAPLSPSGMEPSSGAPPISSGMEPSSSPGSGPPSAVPGGDRTPVGSPNGSDSTAPAAPSSASAIISPKRFVLGISLLITVALGSAVVSL